MALHREALVAAVVPAAAGVVLAEGAAEAVVDVDVVVVEVAVVVAVEVEVADVAEVEVMAEQNLSSSNSSNLRRMLRASARAVLVAGAQP